MKPTLRLWQLLPPLLLLAVLALLPAFGLQANAVRLLFVSFVWITASVGWNILGGYAGQVSFGFAVFYGIGAYTAAILIDAVYLHPYVAILCAGVTAVIASVLIGLPTFRLRGPYFCHRYDRCQRNRTRCGHQPRFYRRRQRLPDCRTAHFQPGRALLLGAGPGGCRGRHLVLDRQQQVRTWPGAIKEDEDAAADAGVNPFTYKLKAHAVAAALTGMAAVCSPAMPRSFIPTACLVFKPASRSCSCPSSAGWAPSGAASSAAVLSALLKKKLSPLSPGHTCSSMEGADRDRAGRAGGNSGRASQSHSQDQEDPVTAEQTNGLPILQVNHLTKFFGGLASDPGR